METFLLKLKDYLLKQMDKATAWIGVICFILLLLHFHTMLYIFFVLLIILPEAEFSNMFKKATTELRDLDKQHGGKTK